MEANSGEVLEIKADGNATRLVDLSKDHPVPTGIARDHDGNLYVGYLTEAPYTPGISRVDKIAPDGTVSTVWTGLTQVTGVAIGADGTLYALEMSAGNGRPRAPAASSNRPDQTATPRSSPVSISLSASATAPMEHSISPSRRRVWARRPAQ